MAQKKDRSRFSIKFRENDPDHERTICILESQGQRNIVPFLVNAVLHYVQCSETQDVAHMVADNSQQAISRDIIEDIVKEILRQQGIIKEEQKPESGMYPIIDNKVIPNIKEEVQTEKVESIKPQNVVNDDMWAMIARTLSSFRKE